MPREHSSDINLKEDATVKLNFKGLWGLILSVIIGTTAVVGYQLKTDYKIERLYLQNQNDHAQLMQKLNEMQIQSSSYAWKKNVENAFVFVTKLRDQQLGSTNGIANDEVKFRKAIQEFLQ